MPHEASSDRSESNWVANDMDNTKEASESHQLNPMSLMIMKCALPGAAVSDAEVELLETIFSAWVLTKRPAFFHGDSTQHTGYVSAVVNDKSVHVPIHLADLIPTRGRLQELVERADEVRAMTDSTICLSGSHVFGINSAVDTDYCEYVMHTGRRLAGSFKKLAEARSSICVRVRHSTMELTGSEVLNGVMDLCSTDSGKVGSDCHCDPRTWKFDFICTSSRVPTAVTNLCVPEGECEEFSWAYQEAAIAAAGQPVPDLIDPLQLGRYVAWLREKVDEYRAEKPLKALKRALSLCTLLNFTATTDVLVILNSPAAMAIATGDAQREMVKLCQYLPESDQGDCAPVPLAGASEITESGFQSEAASLLARVITEYDALRKLAEGWVHGRSHRA